MAEYKLSNAATDDFIRIHHFGVRKFGVAQADKYFDAFFDSFEIIAEMAIVGMQDLRNIF